MSRPLELTPGHLFSIARIGLGLFTTIYAIKLLPYATDLYSSTGMMPDMRMAPAAEVLPHWILGLDHPLLVQFYVILQILAGTAFTLGFMRRSASLVLFVVGWWLIQRNLFSTSPEYALHQWMLLACVFLRPGEPWSLRPRPVPGWTPPISWRFGAWMALGAAYSFSGLSKLDTRIWLNGRAIRYFIENSDAVRPYLWGIDLSWSEPVLSWATHGVLWIQLLSLPMALIPTFWPFLWSVFAAMHFANVFIFDFTQLSVGCLVFHVFLFELRWWTELKEGVRLVLAKTIRAR